MITWESATYIYFGYATLHLVVLIYIAYKVSNI